MPWAAVAGAAINVIGGVIANNAASGDRNAAANAAQQAMAAIQGLQIPDVEKQKLLYQLPQVMGQYFPEAEVNQALGQSQMQGISTDPRLQQAQMSALQKLSETGEQGLTAQDKLVLSQLQRDTAAQEQSREAGIMQNLAQRGIGGSGLELAQKLSSAQGAADRQSQAAMQQAAQAQQRALEATAQAGALGGQIRTQQFGEEAQKAQAADAIAKFNAQQSSAVQQRNVSARNQAQIQNLAEQQRIADMGTTLRNTEQEKNKALIQQQYNNQYQKAAAMAGQYGNQADMYNTRAAQTAGSTKDIFAGIGGIVSAFGKSPTTTIDTKLAGQLENPTTYKPNYSMQDVNESGTTREDYLKNLGSS